MQTFTVFIQQFNGRGTTHISAHEALDSNAAEQMALAETLEDWGEGDINDLRILGIAAGDVCILEWHDIDE